MEIFLHTFQNSQGHICNRKTVSNMLSFFPTKYLVYLVSEFAAFIAQVTLVLGLFEGAPFYVVANFRIWWCVITFNWIMRWMVSIIIGFLMVRNLNFWSNYRLFETTFSHSQCLKITQNVAFDFFNFAIFHQFLSY